MRGATTALLMLAALTGCHSGPMGAAAISGSVSVLTLINQDWVTGQLDFLHVGPPKATPPSQTTPAGAQ